MRGFISSSEIKSEALKYTFRSNNENKKNVLMQIDI